MRRFAALTSVLLLGAVAACSGSSESPDGGGASSAPTAFEERTVPYELVIEAPEGFAYLEDETRDVPVVEGGTDWVFGMDGGDANTRLIVSAYVLPEGTALPDFDSQVPFILDYDAKTGNQVDATNIYPSLVNRYTGVHRYFTNETDGAKLFKRHFFMFAGRHLIQVTCQWQSDQEALVAGCRDLTENFPYPEGWPVYDQIP